MLSEMQRHQIKYWIEEARQILRLQQFDITVKFVKEYCKDNADVLMEADDQQAYINGSVTIYEPKTETEWRTHGERYIRETVYHEVLHIAIGEISDLAHRRFATCKQIEEAEEKFIENISRVIVGLLVDKKSKIRGLELDHVIEDGIDPGIINLPTIPKSTDRPVYIPVGGS